jgi:hypothetical protein
MTAYRRNVFLSAASVFIMVTVIGGELLIRTGLDIAALKGLLKNVVLGLSTGGSLLIGFIWVLGSRRKKQGRSSRPVQARPAYGPPPPVFYRERYVRKVQ